MKNWFKSNRGFIFFVCLFGFFRLAIADWNPIPSGSMLPTLLEGDVVLVNRLAYDFKLPLTNVVLAKVGTPARGDVVTFTSPKDGARLIKRLVAIPGDIIEIRNDALYLNGEPAQYLAAREVAEPTEEGVTRTAIQMRETLDSGGHMVQVMPEVMAMRNFGTVQVPPDHYFFLGDNRDNSADSRFIGMVPRHLLIGHAHRVLVSVNINGNWMPRFDRTFDRIY
jgi:signal peptidase I